MDTRKQILELAKKYRDLTAENLGRMVRIPSESLQEKEVAQETLRQMRDAGFDEARIDGLGNVIGRIGNGKKVLAFDGHIDTVGVGNRDNWYFDPFSGEVKDGYVTGRGTVDQEGGVAAFITAGRILKELGFDKDLTLYFTGTVIEEDCDGLCWKYIVEEEGIRPDWVVSTEPTNLGVYRGQRGRMEIRAHFNGVSSHGSAPGRGVNAIYMASKFCVEIEKLNENLLVDDFLGKGTIAVSEFVSGSPSLCAVADYARVHLDRRLTWGETRETAIAEIESICDSIAHNKHWRIEVLEYEEEAYTGLRYGMEKYYPTWKLEEKHPLVRMGADTFEKLFEETARVDKWTFSTNGVTINGYYDIPVIGFGPGDESLAHSPYEKVPVDHLEKATAFYAYLPYVIAEK